MASPPANASDAPKIWNSNFIQGFNRRKSSQTPQPKTTSKPEKAYQLSGLNLNSSDNEGKKTGINLAAIKTINKAIPPILGMGLVWTLRSCRCGAEFISSHRTCVYDSLGRPE